MVGKAFVILGYGTVFLHMDAGRLKSCLHLHGVKGVKRVIPVSHFTP